MLEGGGTKVTSFLDEDFDTRCDGTDTVFGNDLVIATGGKIGHFEMGTWISHGGAGGTLQQKLAAYVEVQKVWAKAFAERTGNIVPDIIVGKDGTTPGSTNAMDDYLKLLSIKAAKDLQLDASIK